MDNEFLLNKDSIISNTKYGDFGYGTYTYPRFISQDQSDENLPDKIIFFTYKVLNSSAYYLEKFVTRERVNFTKIELNWNYVKDAKAYAIYKGNTKNSLQKYTIVKENFWYDTNPSDGSVFYQIRPLFVTQ